jgi:hypothetical protein
VLQGKYTAKYLSELEVRGYEQVIKICGCPYAREPGEPDSPISTGFWFKSSSAESQRAKTTTFFPNEVLRLLAPEATWRDSRLFVNEHDASLSGILFNVFAPAIACQCYPLSFSIGPHDHLPRILLPGCSPSVVPLRSLSRETQQTSRTIKTATTLAFQQEKSSMLQSLPWSTPASSRSRRVRRGWDCALSKINPLLTNVDTRYGRWNGPPFGRV